MHVVKRKMSKGIKVGTCKYVHEIARLKGHLGPEKLNVQVAKCYAKQFG